MCRLGMFRYIIMLIDRLNIVVFCPVRNNYYSEELQDVSISFVLTAFEQLVIFIMSYLTSITKDLRIIRRISLLHVGCLASVDKPEVLKTYFTRTLKKSPLTRLHNIFIVDQQVLCMLLLQVFTPTIDTSP